MKECTASTPADDVEAKRMLGKEIRRRVDAKDHDQNALRQAYAPKHKAMFLPLDARVRRTQEGLVDPVSSA